MSEQGTLSEDGNWWWDAEAQEWKPVEGADPSSGSSSASTESTEGAPEGGPDVSEDTVANMMTSAEQEASEA